MFRWKRLHKSLKHQRCTIEKLSKGCKSAEHRFYDEEFNSFKVGNGRTQWVGKSPIRGGRTLGNGVLLEPKDGMTDEFRRVFDPQFFLDPLFVRPDGLDG